MTSLLCSPRIPLADAVPIRQARTIPLLAAAALAAVALVIVVMALVAEHVVARILFALMAALFLFFGLFVKALYDSVHQGRVRVEAEATLRFVPASRVLVWPFVLSATGIALGVVGVFAVADSTLDLSSGRRGEWTLVFVGVLAGAWLLQNLWALRRARGLQLSKWGLRGVRGAAPVNLPWDYVLQATAIARRSGAHLQLSVRSGEHITIHGQYLGSDPNVVAAIIEHFRTHPEDDERLANGLGAIRCVEDAQA